MRESLAPVLNDTKWDELRLAMYELGEQSPDFRVKDIRDDRPGPWDGEWFYHFRSGGYSSMEWVELRLADPQQREVVARILESINLPGSHTNEGFVIYGHVVPGSSVEYIRSSSNNKLQRTRGAASERADG